MIVSVTELTALMNRHGIAGEIVSREEGVTFRLVDFQEYSGEEIGVFMFFVDMLKACGVDYEPKNIAGIVVERAAPGVWTGFP